MAQGDLDSFSVTYSVAAETAEPSQLELEAQGWLEALEPTHDVLTVKTCRYYLRRWAQRWTRLHVITDADVASYYRERLRKVRKQTAVKEQSAMRGLFDWAKEQGLLEHAPVVASLPRRALGTPDPKPHKAEPVPLLEHEVLGIIEAAPVRSPGSHNGSVGFLAKWLFATAYWTALRPGTLEALRFPTDYRRGLAVLKIRDAIDKARFGRDLPLCEEARAALDAACPEIGEGLIFGRHDYRAVLRKAAAGILDADRLKHLSLYDLRHARLTRLCELSSNLTGVAYLSGHLRVDTLASRYVHPHKHAADEVVRVTARQLTFNSLLDPTVKR